MTAVFKSKARGNDGWHTVLSSDLQELGLQDGDDYATAAAGPPVSCDLAPGAATGRRKRQSLPYLPAGESEHWQRRKATISTRVFY